MVSSKHKCPTAQDALSPVIHYQVKGALLLPVQSITGELRITHLENGLGQPFFPLLSPGLALSSHKGKDLKTSDVT